MFKTSRHNIRRVTKERAFTHRCLGDIELTVEDYVSKGASAGIPGVVPAGRVGGGDGGAKLDVGDLGCIPRSFRITESDCAKYGYIDDCPGCRWSRFELGPRQNHTVECRKRFIEKMGIDSQDRDRVERAQARQAEWLDKELGQEDKKDDKDGVDNDKEVVEERGKDDRDAMDEEKSKQQGSAEVDPRAGGNELEESGSHSALARGSDQPMAMDDEGTSQIVPENQVVETSKKPSPRKRKQGKRTTEDQAIVKEMEVDKKLDSRRTFNSPDRKPATKRPR